MLIFLVDDLDLLPDQLVLVLLRVDPLVNHHPLADHSHTVLHSVDLDRSLLQRLQLSPLLLLIPSKHDLDFMLQHVSLGSLLGLDLFHSLSVSFVPYGSCLLW